MKRNATTAIEFITVSFLAAASGCALDNGDFDPAGSIESHTKAIVDGGCPPEECGMNGTVLADERFGPLDIDGTPNNNGFSIVDFVDASGVHMMLDARDSRFLGLDPSTGDIVSQEDQLLGARIILSQEQPDGSALEWTMTIQERGTMSFMSNESGSIPSHGLTYAASDGSETGSLCANGGHAVLVIGEEYDPISLNIAPSPSASWFYLACDDQLLSKAKRMSYDPERPEGDEYHTTAAQRRATLGMLAADYCGNGQRFTVPGTPLHWQNQAGWMVLGGTPSPDAVLEGAWDENGAVCLDNPRLSQEYSRSDIETACGRTIPTCTPELLSASEWVTWVP